MKKTLALILAIVMVFALAVPALAANANDGKITVENPVKGQTYSIYKVFDLSYNAANKAYAYTVNSAWTGFEATIKEYFNIDAQGYITTNLSDNAAELAAFAKAALAYAKANDIAATDSKTAGDTVVFANLAYGYYLVDSSLGTLCALGTTDNEAIVKEKNAEPTVDKLVKENTSGLYGKTNTANFGDVVEFKATITTQAGAQNYVLHDKMVNFDSYKIVSVKYDGAVVAAGNYTVVDTGLTDGCTFEIRFSQAFCDTLESNKNIVVEYTAVLNRDGYKATNTASVSYGESFETAPSTTETYSYSFMFVKVFHDNNGASLDDLLAGAQFVLHRGAANGELVKFIAPEASEIEICNEKGQSVRYGVWTGETDEATTTVLSCVWNEIQGLDAGTYYLEETVAPDGYNKLAAPIKIVITEEGVVTADGNAFTQLPDGDDDIMEILFVENFTGSELPSTGGIGTTIFYVVGGMMVLGAAIVLVSKKRMGEEQ